MIETTKTTWVSEMQPSDHLSFKRFEVLHAARSPLRVLHESILAERITALHIAVWYASRHRFGVDIHSLRCRGWWLWEDRDGHRERQHHAWFLFVPSWRLCRGYPAVHGRQDRCLRPSVVAAIFSVSVLTTTGR